jgi:hypothetical protein
VRQTIVVLSLLFGMVATATAQFSMSIGMPGVSIGINVPVYPELVRVPGYPVYYAPGLPTNFFFYDGAYWVYEGDNWYASGWYNGPWSRVAPEVVPLYVLRVPVRYYRSPPPYFRDWRPDAPPRWDKHWGPSWQQRRPGWDQWDRKSAPPPAPLPRYQMQYPESRYPRPEQQRDLREKNYRYQPREEVVRQHVQPPRASPGPRPQPPSAAPPHGDSGNRPAPEPKGKGKDKGHGQGNGPPDQK